MRVLLRCTFIWVAVIALTPAVYARQAPPTPVPPDIIHYPDLIVHNAKVVSMDDYGINSNVGTTAEAMAVRGDKILKLGTNQEILALAGPKTTRVDAQGRLVIPGLVDVHTHIHDYALNDWIDSNPALSQAAVRVFRITGETTEEIRKNIEITLRERMSSVKPGQWSFFNLPNPPHGTGGGPGFDFLRQVMMTDAEIDAIVKDSNKPIILAAHPAYILNTAAQNALRTLYKGEPAGFPDDWDNEGFANMGVEYRREVVVDGYFADKTDQLADIIHKGLLQNAAAGMTTFTSHVMGIQNFDAYMRLWRQGRMPMRFGFTHYTGFTMNPDSEGFYFRLGDMFKLGDDYLWFAGIGVGQLDHGPPLYCSSMVPESERGPKGYMWCRDQPNGPHWKTMITALANGQRVVAGHNYGDLSFDYYMDIIEEAMKRSPTEITLEHVRSLRLSADHGGLYPRPDQLPRIKKLGMFLSMGSQSMSRSLPWVQKYGFEKYQDWVVPVKRALEAGVKVAWEGEGGWRNGLFGDLMVPFLTRTNRQGVVIAKDQAIDRQTLLKMATAWGSEFLIKEDKIGSLEPGKLADFLVLNQDFFEAPIEDLPRTYPLMTVVGGKIVYLRDNFAKEIGLPASPLQVRFSFEGDQQQPGEGRQ